MGVSVPSLVPQFLRGENRTALAIIPQAIAMLDAQIARIANGSRKLKKAKLKKLKAKASMIAWKIAASKKPCQNFPIFHN